MGQTGLPAGLEVLNSTDLPFFSHDLPAGFCALTGLFLSHLTRADAGHTSFRISVRFHDMVLRGCFLWGYFFGAGFASKPSKLPFATLTVLCVPVRLLGM